MLYVCIKEIWGCASGPLRGSAQIDVIIWNVSAVAYFIYTPDKEYWTPLPKKVLERQPK